MDNRPNLIQRQALGNFLSVIKKHNLFLDWETKEQLENYYDDCFINWNPIYDSGLSGYQYYKTLKEYPLYAKRCIIQAVLDGWNIHKSPLILRETIVSLIYLKLCGPAEYFFLLYFYSIMMDYSERLDNLSFVEIDTSISVNKYILRFWKGIDNSFFRETYGIVEFELHDIDEEPSLAIVPWNSILRNVYDLPSEDSQDVLNEREFSLVIEELGDLFGKEWILEHCQWIQSSSDIKCYKEQYNRGLVFILRSLTYQDYNGVQ